MRTCGVYKDHEILRWTRLARSESSGSLQSTIMSNMYGRFVLVEADGKGRVRSADRRSIRRQCMSGKNIQPFSRRSRRSTAVNEWYKAASECQKIAQQHICEDPELFKPDGSSWWYSTFPIDGPRSMSSDWGLFTFAGALDKTSQNNMFNCRSGSSL